MNEMQGKQSSVTGELHVRDWNWWNHFLQREYYGADSESAGWQVAASEVAAAAGLKPGMEVVDLGSGCGELALNLALMGGRVTGIEASSLLAEYCLTLARGRGIAATFVRADMFTWNPSEQVDLVVCVNTSFGYGTETQNLELIARIGSWLRPGGVFYLDAISADRATSFGTWTDDLAGGRLIVDNEWAPVERLMSSSPTWVSPDGAVYVADSPESVRLYHRSVIETSMLQAGLRPRRLRRAMGREVQQDALSMGTTWIATKAAPG